MTYTVPANLWCLINCYSVNLDLRLVPALQNQSWVATKRHHLLTAPCSFQRVWRTSPTSWPLGMRSTQSIRSCGAWRKLRAGGTARGSSTSLRCLTLRTHLLGWSWPNSVTREAQSCSSSMMVRVDNYYRNPRMSKGILGNVVGLSVLLYVRLVTVDSWSMFMFFLNIIS